ncbi:hypothetical protein [Nakamurella deserti]|uniref:hypothetical protein n=1 Tax=Nakamurella deserti TaxID=2164074 RepID=UPI000DBE6B5B|nr:hypothetical protein [Nakamurella deserti]
MTVSPSFRISPATRLAVAAVLVITAVYSLLDPTDVVDLVANLFVAAVGLLMALEGIHQLRAARAGVSVLR